ncbi:hypothetical protein Enr13x_43350 [Stieleria neptunia]|uniref:EF-hand domain-containing protein n=1 Tax=Stieleria neptunia TaxID=2527979 RepID=A0A518HUG5_9BACT|nr:hypothetical protein [Stieleria neptunia]QDV44469.1 hypothetical protein Enr13x_43350 [Stieleria neptunia]
MNRHTIFLAASLMLLVLEYADGQGPLGPPRMPNAGGGLQPQIANSSTTDATAIALRNLPNPQTLAQMMITNYDADASGELNPSELQTALEGLRTMIVQQTQVAQTAVAAQQTQRSFQNVMRNPVNAGIAPPPPAGRPGL